MVHRRPDRGTTLAGIGRQGGLWARRAAASARRPNRAASWPDREESEDCLRLNVWTPAAEGRRPVMVWLHGGGFI